MRNRVVTLSAIRLRLGRLSEAELVRSIPRTFRIPAALTSLVLVSVLLVAMAASTAEAVTPASFFEQIDVPADWEHPFGVILGHSNSLAETVNVAQTWNAFSAVGSATTHGGAVAKASFDLQVSGAGAQGDWLSIRVIAQINYYYMIVQDAGDPYYGNVPILISTKGHVSGFAPGGAKIGYLYAKAYFNWIGSSSTFAADLTNMTGDLSFDKQFKKFLTPGKEYSVGLSAWGQAEVDPGELAEVAGWVDPTFVIDPTWYRAGDFSLHFSDNLVPEPGSLLALSAGLCGLCGVVLRRRK
ncbi:MAG: hypothetical protein A2Z18_05255 [Armatimonadetes bacterium RBG_16_58_9]|nr:MAG: hypothetical protein A2Z18_05255 [Armatimonadetes bacterium RBG_16_58_9]